MEGNSKFSLVQAQERPQSNIEFESLLRKFKLSQKSIQQITDKYQSIDDLIFESNKSMQQIAAEFDLDSIDKLRFIRSMDEIIQKRNYVRTNVKKIIVSTEEQKAMDILYKRFETVSNLINDIQIGINDLNICYDTQIKSIHDYFENVIAKEVMNKREKMILNIDTLNKNKSEILQNQLKTTAVQSQKLNNAKLKCSEITSAQTMSMRQRKKIILKLGSNKYVCLCLCPMTSPMIKFNLNQYLTNINTDFFSHISIDNCDQPIINNVKLIQNAVHTLSIVWSIDEAILKKFNLKKHPSFSGGKV